MRWALFKIDDAKCSFLLMPKRKLSPCMHCCHLCFSKPTYLRCRNCSEVGRQYCRSMDYCHYNIPVSPKHLAALLSALPSKHEFAWIKDSTLRKLAGSAKVLDIQEIFPVAMLTHREILAGRHVFQSTPAKTSHEENQHVQIVARNVLPQLWYIIPIATS